MRQIRQISKTMGKLWCPGTLYVIIVKTITLEREKKPQKGTILSGKSYLRMKVESYLMSSTILQYQQLMHPHVQ